MLHTTEFSPFSSNYSISVCQIGVITFKHFFQLKRKKKIMMIIIIIRFGKLIKNKKLVNVYTEAIF